VSGCSITSGTLTCNVGTLAAGASVVVHLSSPTTAATCGTVSNSATVALTNGSGVSSSVSTVTVSCEATLTVIKHVVNDDGGTALAGDFTMNVSGPTPQSFAGAESPGTTRTVLAGTYTVTETGFTGYVATFSGDCDATGHTTLAPGQSKTCTVTNDDPEPPAVVVVGPCESPPPGAIVATKDNDKVYGTSGNDVIVVLADNDYAYGLDGNDTIYDCGDNDHIDGGNGNDRLYGDDDNDTLIGGNGNDYLDGGNDNDILKGGSGDDVLVAGTGNDKLYGGPDRDHLDGGPQTDYCDGQTGSPDVVDGGCETVRGVP
jgi:Ca2+-binding RTX toxin-like protein